VIGSDRAQFLKGEIKNGKEGGNQEIEESGEESREKREDEVSSEVFLDIPAYGASPTAKLGWRRQFSLIFRSSGAGKTLSRCIESVSHAFLRNAPSSVEIVESRESNQAKAPIYGFFTRRPQTFSRRAELCFGLVIRFDTRRGQAHSISYLHQGGFLGRPHLRRVLGTGIRGPCSTTRSTDKT